MTYKHENRKRKRGIAPKGGKRSQQGKEEERETKENAPAAEGGAAEKPLEMHAYSVVLD